MEKKFKITPDKYSKILNSLKLKSIFLQSSKTYLNPEIKVPENIKINIKEETSYKVKKGNIYNLFQKYKLDARGHNSKSKFINIEIGLIVKVESNSKITEEFFDIYKEISLHLNTWPYFREYVNQATARMNIPPLTLPFFKVSK